MMKFTMHAKELKTMMEKGVAAINKKSVLPYLRRLYLQVEENNMIKVLGMDMEHYVEIRSNDAWNTSPGILGIDIDDMKVISKMNGIITLEDVGTEAEHKIVLKCGKKAVSIPKYDNVDTFLPTMDDTEEHILTMKESWLLETIVNLYTYTAEDDNRKTMQAYNFNTVQKRVEALDNKRIGMRTLENQKIKNDKQNVMLHRKCMSVFKKIMDKKSNAEIKVYQDKKYVRVEGKDFTYIIRRIGGDYFNVDRVLTNKCDYKFTVDREDIVSIMKYNCDLAKGESEPVVFHSENGKLYTYMITSKYETFDEVKTKDITMDNNLYIGFDPSVITDAFNIVDIDNPICRGTNNKSPMYIDGNEYSFVICPVKIENGNIRENISKHINEDKIA